LKILVVDDNRLFAATIRMLLEREGMEVEYAEDGIDGYAAYLRFKPDLVITDIQMPGRNGLEMMEDIRNHDPRIKTIYMSGNLRTFWASLQREKEKYPVSFFEKPFPLASLKQKVSEELQQRTSSVHRN